MHPPILHVKNAQIMAKSARIYKFIEN